MKKIEYSLLSKYRSVLMGAAIISIILFHYTNYIRVLDYNYILIFKAYNKIIGSSGVDIFLLLSGLGLYYSFKKNDNLKKFYKKRFTKILIPYVIFCIPAIFFRDLVIRGGDILLVLKDISFVSFFTDNFVWFWYILMIMICYLIFPYFFKLFDEKQSEQSEQMRMLNIFTFILVIAMLIMNNNKEIFSNINIALLRIPVFAFGVYLGKQAYNKKKLGIGSFIFFVIMSILCLFLLSTNKIIIVRFVIAFFAISYFSLFILFIDKFKNFFLIKWLIAFLSKVGEYTLELYITHVCLITIFRYYRIPIFRLEYYLLLIGICVIISFVLKKLSTLIEKKIIKI